MKVLVTGLLPYDSGKTEFTRSVLNSFGERGYRTMYFKPVGGHNAAEAAQYGCKIISGPNYFNQKEIFAGIEGIKIVENNELADVLQYPALLQRCKIVARRGDLDKLIGDIKSVLSN